MTDPSDSGRGSVSSHPGEELPPGTRVGEYELGEVIGHGGFATVYRAVQPVIGKEVAVKVLRRAYSVDEAIVARFVREARAANAIRHRNIVDVSNFGNLDDGRAYLVMELLEGLTLEEHLKRHGRLAASELCAIMSGVADALQAAHAENIVHRDLKPENIFLCHAGDGSWLPKLLDFGIAKLLADDHVAGSLRTHTGAPLGTPAFMAPEQCLQLPVDARTDVYNFGIMCFYALTGDPPFDGHSFLEVMEKQTKAPRPLVSECRPELGTSFDEAIAAMMAIDPADRPASARAAMTLLLAASGSAGDMAAAPTVPSLPPLPRGSDTKTLVLSAPAPTARSLRRRVWLYPLLAVVLGALGWLVVRRLLLPDSPRDRGADVAPMSSPAAVALPSVGGKLRVGVIGPRGQLGVYGHSITPATLAMRHVVELLIAQDPKGMFEPRALEAMTLSDDAKSLRLTLRSDLVFHAHPCLGSQPRPADARDLVYSLTLAAREPLVRMPIEGVADFLSGRATSIRGIEPDGARSVEVSLNEPAPLVHSLLSQTYLLPHELGTCGSENVRDMRWPVGTGPFKADGPVVDQVITLSRHEPYRRTADGSTPSPSLAAIELAPIEDAAQGVRLVKSGDLDIAVLLRYDAEPVVVRDGDGRIRLRSELASPQLMLAGERPSPTVDLAVIVPMLSKRGPLQDVRIRKALAYGVDRERIAAAYPGGIAAYGRVFPPGLMGDIVSPGYRFDPEHAQALLAKAGYPGGARLKEIVIGTTATREAALRVVSEQLAALGITVRQEILTRSDFEKVLERKLIDALLVNLNMDARDNEPFPFLLALLESYDQASPRARELKYLASAIQREVRIGKRELLYEHFERAALEDAIVIPLGHKPSDSPMFLFVVRDNVTNLVDEQGRMLRGYGDWFFDAKLKPTPSADRD